MKPIPPGARFDPYWLKIGTDVEMEHTSSRELAEIIAKQHLHFEHPLYYAELLPMEKRLKSIPKPALANFDSEDLWTVWRVLAVASSGVCAYHGYRRNESVGWALAWGLFGAAMPVMAPSIAFAQGYGKPKP